MGIKLSDVVGFQDKDVDALFREWREAIEAAHRWEVKGHATFDQDANRFALYVKPPLYALPAVAAEGGISAAPDADTLGQGFAIIRHRNGAALMSGRTVKVYSNFTVAVPAGTRLGIVPDGADYLLMGADCPAS